MTETTTATGSGSSEPADGTAGGAEEDNGALGQRVDNGDPDLQQWLDDFLAEEPTIGLTHGANSDTVPAAMIYELLNEYLEPKPYGPGNPPPRYAESIWKPVPPMLHDGPNSGGGPKHNAKHRKLGMFHK
jgi:hypothetical protein